MSQPLAIFDALNLAVLTVFKEPFTLTSAGGPVFLEGVFDDRITQEGVASVGFNDRMHNLTVLQEVVDTHQIAAKQTVTVRGQTYSILSVLDDIGGMAVLTLRKYS